jgi:hypothetical protein
MLHTRQRLGHDVRCLLLSAHEGELDQPLCYRLAIEVILHIDVFSALVVYGVPGQRYAALIIRSDLSRIRHVIPNTF